MEKDNYIGMVLDNRYKIEQLIGVGGMAYVFTAEDTQEHRTVAVKILKDEFASNREFVKKFVNESKVLSGLSHPSIVEVFDVSFDGDPKFMIMEYIDGITLKEYMDTQGALSWKDSVHFTIQILRALHHAHARGVIHRDIKPHNIMLFTDGTVKVMDFGISKIAREEVKSSTEHALGSVHYISPEQAQGQSTDEKSDIYSLGCVLYEMLTGQKPFDSDNPVTVALMHSKDIAPNPRSINDSIPIGLEQIIMKAMEKEPSKRYQTADEMIQALQTFRKNPDVVFNYGEEENIIEDNKSEKVLVEAEGYPAGVNDGYSNTGEIQTSGRQLPPDEPEEPDEPEVVVERSFFLPILTGITLVIIIVAVIFVASLIKDTFGVDNWKNPEFTMPNLVGMNYEDAKSQYPELNISISAEQYSETYEANAIMEQNVEVGTLCKQGKAVDIIISKGVKMIKVPEVANFEYSVAEQTLKNEGLVVEKKFQYDDDIAENIVIKTEPEAKQEVAPGTRVVMYVSIGRYTVIVKVPNLTGMTVDAAKALLESKGLTWKTVYQDSNEPEGIVLGQNIQPDTEMEDKSEVEIYVSNGTPPTNSVSVNFQMPSNASGTFTFQIFIDGKLSMEKTGVVADTTNGSTTITLEGNGVQLVTVRVKNEANGLTAEYGRYNINFDDPSQPLEVISSKIEQAFIEINGIAVVTQPVYTNPPQTDPPVYYTDPPQTDPPVEYTDPPVEYTDPPVDTTIYEDNGFVSDIVEETTVDINAGY
ncbi:MAG: Stk1 family PASTA domain-containing Ser/Thr kinase [Oscillospiraceae bacterium]